MQYELGSGWMTARPSCQDNNNHTIESAVICRGGRDGDKEWKSAAGSTPESTVNIESLVWTASGCRPIATVLSQHFPGHVQPQVCHPFQAINSLSSVCLSFSLSFTFFPLIIASHLSSVSPVSSASSRNIYRSLVRLRAVAPSWLPILPIIARLHKAAFWRVETHLTMTPRIRSSSSLSR